jgi:5S rRNA maturation endonuclease (ribonuclease M5)
VARQQTDQHLDQIKARFATDPMPIVSALGLRVDDRKSKLPHSVWVFDGPEDEASLLIGGKLPGLWARFGTDEKGDVFALVMRCRRCQFPEALQLAADAYGIALPERGRARSAEVRHVVYQVRDAAGELVAEHHRSEREDGSKAMWWERMGRKGLGGMSVQKLPLWRLPELLETDPRRAVIITEGEKACEALRELGEVATATYGASDVPDVVSLQPLVGRDVYLWPDADEAGRKHMEQLAAALHGIGVRPRVIAWADAPPKGDAADWGGTPDDLDEMERTAAAWEPGLLWMAPALDTLDAGALEGPGERKPRRLGVWDWQGFCERLSAPEATPKVVWDAIDDLVGLEQVQLAQAKSAIRERFGTQIPVVELNAALKEGKVKRRQRQREGSDGTRPVVVLGRQLRNEVADALDALQAANDPPAIYWRYGSLARVTMDESQRPTVEAVTVDALRARLAEIANWVSYSREGERDCAPPEVVARTIMALGEWPFPPLDAIVEHPVVRPGGEIVDKPGYDPVTHVLYVDTGKLTMPTIPLEPTADELSAAVSAVMECVAEFPFEDGAGFPNVFAMLLTPLVRPAIQGPVPLACVTAPAAGTGKSLLTEIAAIIATGSTASMFGAPTNPEEWEKSIFAQIVAGSTMVVIDNVDTILRDPTLCRALTGEALSGRILGRTAIAEVRSRAVWMASGNNLRVGGDVPRRCYWIRLDAKTDAPEAREFAIPNLKRYVVAHRGDLIAALLTMVRAWYSRGCPEWQRDGAVDLLGSFEEWQGMIGGILDVAGIAGFMANQTEMRELADNDTPVWRAFLEVWHRYIRDPVTSKTVIQAARDHPDLGETVPDWMIDRGEINARKLGNALAQREGRRYNEEGLRVVRVGTHARAVRWQVVKDRSDTATSQTHLLPSEPDDV